nr:Ovarian tumor-associated gene 12 (OTAG12) [Euglena gracilis]|eukprot:EG_transcript_32188
MASNVIPGKLQLKGQPLTVVGEKKKKKRKAEELAVAVVPEATKAEEKPKEKVDPRTPAERAYDEELQARAKLKAQKIAAKSYRDRIDEFNAKIATISEHYDIPKVGPG